MDIIRHHYGITRRILVVSVILLLALVFLVVVPGVPFPLKLLVRHAAQPVYSGPEATTTYFQRPASVTKKAWKESNRYCGMLAAGPTVSRFRRALLQDHWASQHLRGYFGLRLVGEAALDNRPGVLKMLFSRGAPPNGIITFGTQENTPLDVAVHFGHNEVVKVLLAAGADPYERFRGVGGITTPYQEAVARKRRKIVALMKAAMARRHAAGGGNERPSTRP